MWMHASRPRWDLMKFTPQMQLKWENNGWRERYWSASRTEPWQDWAANTIHRHLQESTFTKTHTDSLSLSLSASLFPFSLRECDKKLWISFHQEVQEGKCCSCRFYLYRTFRTVHKSSFWAAVQTAAAGAAAVLHRVLYLVSINQTAVLITQ